MQVHKRITITGRVQGVFYRASTYDKALELGLKGYVKNQLDGSVYAEAEGELAKVNALIEWCRQGPAYAHVDAVFSEEGPIKGFEDFQIRR